MAKAKKMFTYKYTANGEIEMILIFCQNVPLFSVQVSVTLRYTGTNISCAIIAVADAYDAMTSNRSYRKLLPQETVKQEIEKGLGTQFNPKWGKIMLKLIEKDKDYKMHQ